MRFHRGGCGVPGRRWQDRACGPASPKRDTGYSQPFTRNQTNGTTTLSRIIAQPNS